MRRFLLICIAVLAVSCSKDKFDIPRHEIKYDSYPETRLDIYSDSANDGNLKPVVVYVHGGGWNGGDKSEFSKNQIQLFIDNGYVCVRVNYRLSPSVVHPTHIMDVSKAIAWVQNNIDNYGGDPTRIILVGHSAGAHLVALAATNQKYIRNAGVDIRNICMVCVLDAGPYLVMNDLVYGDRNILNMIYEAIGTSEESSSVWYDFAPYNFIKDDTYIPYIALVHSDNSLRCSANGMFGEGLKAFGYDYSEYVLAGYTHSEVLRGFPVYSADTNILDIINVISHE